MLGLSVSTKLRNDSEMDFPNVVILIFVLRIQKKKKVNEKNTATTLKGEIVRTTLENRSESLHHGDRVVQRFHPGKKLDRHTNSGKKHSGQP